MADLSTAVVCVAKAGSMIIAHSDLSVVTYEERLDGVSAGCRHRHCWPSTASGHTVEAFCVSDHGQVWVGDDYATSFDDSNNVGAQVHNSGSVTNTFNLSGFGENLSHCLLKTGN